MKRKMVTMLMAATLCTVMLGSTAMAQELDESNLGETGATITGDSGLENPVYKIVVPTALDFAVDPFEQKGQSQVYSKDFYMVNKSNVPVQLDCAVTLSAAAGVTIKDAAADVTETNSDKLIYMEAEIPGAVVQTTKAAAAYIPPLVTDGTDVYESGTGKAPSGATTAVEDMEDTTDAKGTYTSNKKVGLGTTEKKLCFALEKATYKDYFTKDDKSTSAKIFQKVAADDKGSAAFRFSGKVNTKATWVEDAVTASVKYTFNGLTGSNYSDLTATPVANAHAYVEGDKNVVESNGTNDVIIYYTGTQPQSVTLTPVNITGTTKTPMTKSNGTEVVIDSEKVTIKASFIDALIKATARGKGTYEVTIGTQKTTVTFK